MNVMNEILEKIQAYDTIIILKSGSWQLAMTSRP